MNQMQQQMTQMRDGRPDAANAPGSAAQLPARRRLDGTGPPVQGMSVQCILEPALREGNDLKNQSSRMMKNVRDLSSQDAQDKQQSWPDLGLTDLRNNCNREIGPRGRFPAATGYKEDLPRRDHRC
eukprot:11203086-Heterocapsa_arctica.AAC.1